MPLTEEQIESRKKGIGGSDSPVIVLDDFPFKTRLQLWQEKTGILGQQEVTPAMQRGTVMEGLIADMYSQETGRKLRRRNQSIVHPDFPFILGNIDREIVGTGKGVGVLEIKCPGLRTFAKCKRYGLPDYYQIQLQHYMMLRRAEWGAFAVFSAEKWEMIHFDVQRDRDLVDLIVKMDREFWLDYVEKGIPPEEKTGTQIELPPLERGGEIVKIHNSAWKDVVKEYREADEMLKEATEIKDFAKERLQNLMTLNQADVAEGANARIYWKQQAGRKIFDKTKLKADHPEIDLSKYYKQGNASRSFRFYDIKEEIRYE